MAGRGSSVFDDDGIPVIPGVEFTRELAEKTDKQLRAMYRTDREVMERRVKVPPREAAAVAEARSRVDELTGQRWVVEHHARLRADAEWVAANPLELPKLPWWPRWRRQFQVRVRERMEWEYRDHPERRRFAADAVEAAAQRFYEEYRREQGVDFLDLLNEAYAALSVVEEPARKREHLRTAAQLRSQVVVRVLYERHDEDVRWVAGFLGTTQARIRAALGLPPPRAAERRYGSGGDGGYWGGDFGSGGDGGGDGGGGGGGE